MSARRRRGRRRSSGSSRGTRRRRWRAAPSERARRRRGRRWRRRGRPRSRLDRERRVRRRGSSFSRTARFASSAGVRGASTHGWMTLTSRSIPAPRRRPRIHSLTTTTASPKIHCPTPRSSAARSRSSARPAPSTPSAGEHATRSERRSNDAGLGANTKCHTSCASPRSKRRTTRAFWASPGAKRPGVA